MGNRFSLRHMFPLTAVAAFFSAAFAQWGIRGVFIAIVALALCWHGGVYACMSIRQQRWVRFFGLVFGSTLLLLGVIFGALALFPWMNGPEVKIVH